MRSLPLNLIPERLKLTPGYLIKMANNLNPNHTIKNEKQNK